MSMDFQIQLASSLGNKTGFLPELKKTMVRPLAQLAVKTIEQNHVEPGVLNRISEKYNIPQEKIDEWYATILTILRLHLRAPTGSIKPTEFKQCLQELKLLPECIEDLSTVAYGQRRPLLIQSLSEKLKFYPHFKLCKWRIDITISSSTLSRVLQSVVLMEWFLSTEECCTFELSLAQFHRLRHTVANLLMEMHTLENCSTFKSI
ncbi:COMM domain-containing protein 5 [Orussus abietinus]|uniref:COMM domain-containing protein 5 n=1 Tax=Orussus abietinus TaxID=222816 RepID=UPI00062687E1|nr:COMM domain-containing protein 5 [Orussus abietinus]